MEMGNNMPATPKEYFRSMGILHKAMVIGAVLFAVVTILLLCRPMAVECWALRKRKEQDWYFIVAAILAGVCFFRAYMSYNKSVNNIRNGEGSLLKN